MFFIYDCNDNVIGNPKGYRTMRGAKQQVYSSRTKIHRQIWDAYYAKKATGSDDRGVSSIRMKREA